ncbi:MAG: branched-chain amino acid ABC transporter permease [Tissierellia bacterium]|nr:branched-chain amino acid ABC transporter permease [Tissierellia bacterium]
MTRERKGMYLLTLILLVAFYGVLFLLGATGMMTRFVKSLIILTCINIILATSLNITVGNLGQITLGHAGFMSVGAYSAALFTKAGILPGIPGYLVGLLIGGTLACIIGIAIGIPALRLKGDYLAIITLAFGEIIRALIEYFDFTGGAQGLLGIPKVQYIGLIYGIMCLSVTLMFSVMTSRHGRAVLAIREDEIAAEASGVPITFYKTFAFALSAFFAGIAGGVYAHNVGILGAKLFDYNYSINILVMVVLGGMGSFTGATLSAIVLTIIPALLISFDEYRMIIYALILIIMMIFRPEGLLGRKEFSLSAFVHNVIKGRRVRE